jgi:hypothetical protein
MSAAPLHLVPVAGPRGLRAPSTEPIRREPTTITRSTEPAPSPTPTTTSATSSRRVITEPQAARRLARAIASDIILYNDEAVRKARASGAVPESLAKEIEEGRTLFRERVSPENEALYQPAIDELVLEKGKPKAAQ